MLLTEYNEAETMQMFKEEGREEGFAEGRAEGLEEGHTKGLEKGREEGREKDENARGDEKSKVDVLCDLVLVNKTGFVFVHRFIVH